MQSRTHFQSCMSNQNHQNIKYHQNHYNCHHRYTQKLMFPYIFSYPLQFRNFQSNMKELEVTSKVRIKQLIVFPETFWFSMLLRLLERIYNQKTKVTPSTIIFEISKVLGYVGYQRLNLIFRFCFAIVTIPDVTFDNIAFKLTVFRGYLNNVTYYRNNYQTI